MKDKVIIGWCEKCSEPVYEQDYSVSFGSDIYHEECFPHHTGAEE